ncbi:hypothetical protein DPEC_G00021740 [Dallia pectoralis]|uniref:Uncharacterized protein n=1 Tax=Dallia pectoralis TaxID=75939 RepID=A0ACC2HG93_DALPE|nr:hypothetical protein DPEC_G00021740 [Dallia pectoralis]
MSAGASRSLDFPLFSPQPSSRLTSNQAPPLEPSSTPTPAPVPPSQISPTSGGRSDFNNSTENEKPGV